MSNTKNWKTSARSCYSLIALAVFWLSEVMNTYQLARALYVLLANIDCARTCFILRSFNNMIIKSESYYNQPINPRRQVKFSLNINRSE